jgi:hypothetical protein
MRPWAMRIWPPPGFIAIRVNEELVKAMKNFRYGRE